MLRWLRRRRHGDGRHTVIGQRVRYLMPAPQGKMLRAEADIAELRARADVQDEALAVIAENKAASPPPPLQLVAAAHTYCPRGKAVHLHSTSGTEHVIVVDGHGDPQEWWSYVNAQEAGRPGRQAS